MHEYITYREYLIKYSEYNTHTSRVVVYSTHTRTWRHVQYTHVESTQSISRPRRFPRPEGQTFRLLCPSSSWWRPPGSGTCASCRGGGPGRSSGSARTASHSSWAVSSTASDSLLFRSSSIYWKNNNIVNIVENRKGDIDQKPKSGKTGNFQIEDFLWKLCCFNSKLIITSPLLKPGFSIFLTGKKTYFVSREKQ